MKMPITTAVCLLLLTSSAVGAQTPGETEEDRWTGILQGRMGEQVAEWEELGLPLKDTGIPIKAKNVAGDKSVPVELELEGGKVYLILGVCEDACEDIDLYAYDSAGDLLGSDIEDDAIPVVELNVEETMRVSINLVMKKCDPGQERPGCWATLGAYVPD